jgi:hypothetical protein
MANTQEPIRLLAGRVWKILSHISTVITFWQLLSATSAFASVLLLKRWIVMSWPATGTVFFGTLFVAEGIRRTVSRLAPHIRAKINPPSVVIIEHGGERKAFLELTHSGTPATWTAYIRLLRMVPDAPNPDHRRYRSYLHKDKKQSIEMLLRDGERAVIELAEIVNSGWANGEFTYVLNSELPTGIRFRTIGVIIECELTASPPTREGTITRCFAVGLDKYRHLGIEDVPFDKHKL